MIGRILKSGGKDVFFSSELAAALVLLGVADTGLFLGSFGSLAGLSLVFLGVFDLTFFFLLLVLTPTFFLVVALAA